ncbi:TetR/AcrR family transcriptional regulator [Nocardia cyriacigeorgica]|uniref:TetR/AcrR family transcriptional regulator n=2 Tax=Nocardia cyriacigeorgica TaxID=135487 RepID=A0A5R8PJI8_9NOCA|nr:TetR/AcrR family transcriptional regulator [Nocardia cyriacigeorgica]
MNRYRADMPGTTSPRVGRPRDRDVDAALLEAAARLVVERGYAALSLQAVADEAETSRPALYRRYADRAELVMAVLIDRFGLQPGGLDLGGLEAELLAIQRHQRDLFTEPVLCKALPGLLADLASNPEAARRFQEQFLTPRRVSTASILERAVARGEIAPGVDPEWICDLITGPMLMRALVPSLGPIDDELVRLTVRSALDALGYRGGRS